MNAATTHAVHVAAEMVKDIGIILGAGAAVCAPVYRWWLKPKIAEAKQFIARVDAAVEQVPELHTRVARVHEAIGQNGGRSLGALVVRTDARLTLLIDALTTITWEARSDGQNLRVNRAFEDWCGWSSADLKGNGWKVLLPVDVIDAYTEAWESCVAEHRPFRFGPVEFRLKSGRTELVRVSANPSMVDPDHSYWLGTVERVDRDEI